MRLFVSVSVTLLIAISSVTTADKNAERKVDLKNAVKPKREAPLSGTGYNGPSYKYLPPSADAHVTAAVFGGGGGYDYSSPTSGAGSYHGTGYGGGNFGNIGGAGHAEANVETYIVQTEQAGHNGGFGGYKYNRGPASFGGASSFGGGHGGASSFGGGHGGGSSGIGYKSPPKVQTFILPTNNNLAGFSANGGGYGYSKGHHSFGAGSDASFGHSSFGGGGAGAGGGYAGNSGSSSGQTGYHYTPSLVGSSGFGPSAGYDTPSLGGGGYNGFTAHSNSQASHNAASSFGGGSAQNSIAGYSYNSPAASFSHASSNVPSTSYGVPSGSIAASYSQNYQGNANAYSSAGTADETPTYALGHKGLGHFGYTSGKPHNSLNTNIIGSTKYSNALYADSKAPFKPSTFLGNSHESGASSNYNAPSAEYLPPSTSNEGYNYPAPPPAVLYGAPGHSGESAAPIHESDSYLPPL